MALAGGPSGRNPEMQAIYAVEMATRNPDICNFCDLESQRVLGRFATHVVIDNLYPYELFDDMVVSDHILVVPRRHVFGISEFTADEREDYMDTIAEYEEDGYTIFSRAAQNKAKSVAHQHTHLIKPNMEVGAIASLMFNRAPHVVNYTLTSE